jgi:hypothetical protein
MFLVRRGDQPVIVVAKTEWLPERIQAIVRESLMNHGVVDPGALARIYKRDV